MRRVCALVHRLSGWGKGDANMDKIKRIREKFLIFIDTIRTSNIYIYIHQNSSVIISCAVQLLLFLVFFLTGVFDERTFWAAAIPALGTIAVIFKGTNLMSDKLRIMGLSVDYMLNKNGVTIDDVLGILISNKIKKRIVEPTRVFFDALLNLCDQGDYEQRRRIAEALPALYRLNKKSTKLLIDKKLRGDYDENRWHDDNRRRTVEALTYFPKWENRFVKTCLRIREGDSIYTIIAIVENIIFTNKFKLEEKQDLLGLLEREIATYGFNQETHAFLANAASFGERINGFSQDVLGIYDYFKQEFTATNDLYIKILIAKNILYICPHKKKCISNCDCKDVATCASCILDFFDLCFEESNHCNVRRPMAKEDVFHCLLSMLNHTTCRKKARQKIMSLIMESDTIIALTAFDYIYKIYDIDRYLFDEIINYCENLSGDDPLILELRERAGHVKDTIRIVLCG